MDIDFHTPFARALNTNYVPSSTEQRSLRDIVQGPEEQIRQLDEEISRLQAKRQRLKHFVDLHRTLLTPSRLIPVDIWRLIFTECLPTVSYGLCVPTMKSVPLLLTTVCRLWREIALSTPVLWSSIHVYVPAPSPSIPDQDYIARLRGRKEGFRAWLDRSGSLPITISLGAARYRRRGLVFQGGALTDASEEARNAQRTEFTELLAQYSYRWRMVAFSSGAQSLDLTPFERLPASSLSSLKSIYSLGTLFNRSEQSAPSFNVQYAHEKPPSPVAKLLTRAPSLRRLELSSTDIFTTNLSLPVPWYHLTKLSITRPVFNSSLLPGQLMQTLAAKCHSLATLSITFDSGNFGTAVGVDPIRWSSLQKLCIVFCGTVLRFPVRSSGGVGEVVPQVYSPVFLPGVVQTFDSVTLPSLRKLSVGFYSGKDDGTFGNYSAKLPFEDLLQRSQCPLTHFEIFNPHIVLAEKIIDVLRQLETLESLNLGYNRSRISERGGIECPRSSWSFVTDASSTWKRDWLGRILREFSSPGFDVDTQALDASRIPVCPRLKDFSVGGCVLDDRDVLLDLLTKRRRADLEMIRVDLGRVLRRDVWRIFDSLQMQRQDSEARIVRDTGGVVLDWRWDEQEDPPVVPAFDTAAPGKLPQDSSQWDESLWW
ncbi:hypothetical protein PQX77_005822 [Marasmius sp. AFHP31]|nr:hypothetical protein PQX77_005822 [Marasmius sp. AFHP31]